MKMDKSVLTVQEMFDNGQKFGKVWNAIERLQSDYLIK